MSDKLYRIKVLHGAPKDNHMSIETYLVAGDELEVYEWLDRQGCGRWSDHTDDGRTMFEDGWEEIPFKEWVLKNKGDLEDEDGWEDAYYGVTKWGWEEVEVGDGVIQILLNVGIAERVK